MPPRFPIDAVKIDRSFVDGLVSSPEDSAIVGAVISMGRSLGLHVIPDVETATPGVEIPQRRVDAPLQSPHVL